MVQTLEQLLAIMPAPETPLSASGDWSGVVSMLGTDLPSDFVAFINMYGTGCIAEFLWVFNPFEKNVHLNLLSCSRLILEADREFRESYPQSLPEPLFPEPGGLLPWAVTDNGDRLYWRTKGDQNTWTVVVWESRGPEYESYALSMTGFLSAWLQGDIEVPVFPIEAWNPRFKQSPTYDE